MKRLRSLGPGLLVTAAFIGPGTLTTASRAGAQYQFALLWAVSFAVVTAIVLQEMAARLGLAGRAGLGEAIRTSFHRPAARTAVAVLVIAAIAVGNAAYQAGNITGAAMGLSLIVAADGAEPDARWLTPVWAVLIGSVAAALLMVGIYRIIERVLIVLVVLMSCVFLLTAVYVQPSVGPLLAGLLVPSVPSVPDGAWLTIIAMIGTTVVPYNLFLHSSAVREKWPADIPTRRALSEARTDTALAVGLGGFVTLAVVITAAAATVQLGTAIDRPDKMAASLAPLLGALARPVFAVGILAAGLTSAITAPLAAAYATSGVLGWGANLKSWRFRAVWMAILVIGTFFAAIGRKPTEAIVVAQALNGLLLPVIATFLLLVMNRRDLLGDDRNGPLANSIGVTVVLLATGLGGYNLVKAAFSVWP